MLLIEELLFQSPDQDGDDRHEKPHIHAVDKIAPAADEIEIENAEYTDLESKGEPAAQVMLPAGEPEREHDEQQVHGLMLEKSHRAGIEQLAEALAKARRGPCHVTGGGYGVHGLLIK